MRAPPSRATFYHDARRRAAAAARVIDVATKIDAMMLMIMMRAAARYAARHASATQCACAAYRRYARMRYERYYC